MSSLYEYIDGESNRVTYLKLRNFRFRETSTTLLGLFINQSDILRRSKKAATVAEVSSFTSTIENFLTIGFLFKFSGM